MTNKEWIDKKLQFIEKYKVAQNAASGSEVDANANVTAKNIATLQSEIVKDDMIQINRAVMEKYLTPLYGEDVVKQFEKDLKNHYIYSHDETGLAPYTYSPNEVINIKYHGKQLLVSFENLYNIIDAEEELLDADKGVWVKYPEDMMIRDKDGWTTVERVIKKNRHRDLVRVKTAFGEDLVVTDNHPLIAGENVEDTISAIDAEGKQQFKPKFNLERASNKTISLFNICNNFKTVKYDSNFTIQNKDNGIAELSPLTLDLTEELGYFIGFFIGDGNYCHENGVLQPTKIIITQKEKSTLENLANIAIKYFNAIPIIEDKGDSAYRLVIKSTSLVALLTQYFSIGDYSYYKSLPINILETNKDFAKGLIWGLVDSDGTIKNNTACVRLASRTCINQLNWILKDLDFSVGTSWQEAPVGFPNLEEEKYTQNYTIWGSTFSPRTADAISKYSYKKDRLTLFEGTRKYKQSGWVNIQSIKKVNETKYLLDKCKYIYDITTDSHSFICNNIWAHNCVAVSLYPFLLNGLKDLGGSSLPPKHADSYIGGMINLIFLLAGQYLGACMYKDQKVFIKKDGKTYSIISKDLYDLIEGNETIFNTLTDQWEYKTVKDIEIYENGKWVKLNKVLRRPYLDDIYNVKTKTGISVFTSKDHKFKLYEKNNYTLKAEELKIGDKICADVNLFEDHKQIEFDEIAEINKFVNDDEYVYEVETETHWYNCGGLITHNCAVPEFIPYFDHFLRVDFGDDYIEHLDESVITYGKRKETLRDRIEDWFQQFVYSINQPAGSRNYQSPFVNISYYDKGYFESIFNGFVFPDGDEPKWETTKELQKMFIKWFNKERTKTILTFPVETFNTLFDKTTKKYKDEESADFIADAWAHGHSFFVYNSDSADALSSCCFDYNTPVTIKVEKDKTPVNGYIGSLYEQYHDKSIKTLSNGKWAKAKLIKLPNRPMLKITFLDENKWRKTVVVSDNHLHPTQRGDVETSKLTLNDKLKYAPDIYSKKYTFVDIVSIEPYKYSGDIYCFEMEDQTNPYFTLLNGLITHNCRLKNAIEENVFSYTLGAGGIQTGSKKVITLNLNRIVQDWFNKYKDKQTLNDYITTIVKRVHKYLTAWNHWLWDLYDADLLTVYKAGFISLDKQYLTVGM